MDEKDLVRQKKLETLQDKHGILTAEKRALKGELNVITARMAEKNKELAKVGQAIYDLKHVDGMPAHITDHAIVRYLERVEGLDIWDIKAKIMQHRNSVNVDNTIVTVNGEE